MQNAYQAIADFLRAGIRKVALGTAFLGMSGAAVSADPAAEMLAGAQRWVADQREIATSAVTLGKLDERLQVPACKAARGWLYDFPFASQDTVRARCAQPVIQFYVRVLSAGEPMKTANVEKPSAAPVLRPAVILKKGLLRGTRLAADDLQLVQVPTSGLPLRSIDNIENAIDAELTRDVRAGRPLRSADLRPALMVKRGQTVTLTIRQPSGFAVTAQVEALQDGRKGDSIRLKNRESGRILTGRVVGLNSLEVQ